MSSRRSPDSERSPENGAQGKLLVICETWDGRAIKPALEVVGEARTLANRWAGRTVIDAVVCGDMEEPGSTLGSLGVDTVYHCTSPLGTYNPSMFVETLETFVRQHAPFLILCAHTLWGAEVVARLAVELEAPLVSNCVELLKVSNEGLSALESMQGGHLHRECSFPWQGLAIVSWNPDSLGPSAVYEGRSAPVEALPLSCLSRSDAVRSVRLVEGDVHSMPLEEADRILAFGRGMDPEDLPGLQELASELRASVGGTRPVVDAGLLPFERQIGQTGVSVSPKLLMAWGISGANEFTVGIEEADSIVSVNTDPQARMLMFSDLGLVGDGKAILRLLLELLKRGDAGAGASSEEVA
jgi:electron transfer flavoprotein alpha subunit